jgi:pilus assembly protein CpaF
MREITAIQKHLLETGQQAGGYSQEELINDLYNDIFEYSVLTDLLSNNLIDEIDIKAWNDVRIRLANGKFAQAESFPSSRLAKETITRLLKESGLSCEQPLVCGPLKHHHAQITVLHPPAIRQGCQCHIKKCNQRTVTGQEYQAEGFASGKELDFLNTILRHGVSILITGMADSGKTPFINYLVSSLPDTVQSVTFGRGQRNTGDELLLSDDELNDFISQTRCMGADVAAFNFPTWAAQQAARHCPAVIAQSDGNSSLSGIENAAFEWMKKSPCKVSEGFALTCQAFPVVVFLHKLPDRKKRLMNISECRYEHGEIRLYPIWEYRVECVKEENQEVKIIGSHIQTGNISDQLVGRMKLFGASSEEIFSIKKEPN